MAHRRRHNVRKSGIRWARHRFVLYGSVLSASSLIPTAAFRESDNRQSVLCRTSDNECEMYVGRRASSQRDAPESQSIHDDRYRTQTHCGAGNSDMDTVLLRARRAGHFLWEVACRHGDSHSGRRRRRKLRMFDQRYDILLISTA